MFSTTMLNPDITVSMAHPSLSFSTLCQRWYYAFKSPSSIRKAWSWKSKSWRSAKVIAVRSGRYTLHIVILMAFMNNCTAAVWLSLHRRTT
jgi:hypothetical protein